MSVEKDSERQRHAKWVEQVHRFLRSGFGTEDIAVMMNCKLIDVKAEVEALCESGKLKKIYGIGE